MEHKLFRLAALVVTLGCPAIAQIAILHIQFVEGDGAVHAPGSRSARPLVVEVADETGRPVPSASVSFHLPAEGPGGVFSNGLHTEVAVTDAQGRVALHGLQVNRLPGRFQIRVIATREQARAGVVSSQYVAEPRSGAAASASRGRSRWVVVAAVVGGGAAAGFLSAGRNRTTAPATPAAPPVAAAVTVAPISIGTPVTTVGRP